MSLSRQEIRDAMYRWIQAWDRFDLQGVLSFMHEDVLFENWTGGRAKGKASLRKAWQPWFAQADFRFTEEELFIDEADQKLLFRWTLQWPCPDPTYQDQIETRRGVDVIHLLHGRIINKLTYSKTTVEIDGRRHVL